MSTKVLQRQHFASMLNELIERGVRQDALARLLGVVPNTITNWKKGHTERFWHIERLYKKLHSFYKIQISSFELDTKQPLE